MEPSSQTPRPIPEEVENQRHFNELRGELLNAREKVVDRWLTTVAAILSESFEVKYSDVSWSDDTMVAG